MLRNFRKPLIIVAPKILLRHNAATSPITDMESQTKFQNVIGIFPIIKNNNSCLLKLIYQKNVLFEFAFIGKSKMFALR